MAAFKTSPGSLPTEKQLRQSLKNLKYSQHGVTAKHIMTTIEQFTDLKPSIRECAYGDPSIRGLTLVQLSGCVETNNSGEKIRIPVRVWLNKGYPRDPPVIYINLAPNMGFTDTQYMQKDGKVDLGQILTWKEGKSNLYSLAQELCTRFNQRCPIHMAAPKSSTNQFTFSRHLKLSYSTLSLREPSASLQSTPHYKCCNHEDEVDKLRSELEEKNAKIRSLEDILGEMKGKVAYYQNQTNELEGELKAQRFNARGSFSTGVFDALMQHDVWKEKQEKEACKQRMEKMVTELTELRESVGILKADREECEEKFNLLTIEYERVRFINFKLVKERKYMIERQRQLIEQTRSDTDDTNSEYESLSDTIAEEDTDAEDVSDNITEQFSTVSEDKDEGGPMVNYDSSIIETAAHITITVSEDTKSHNNATDTTNKIENNGDTNIQLIEELRKETQTQKAEIESLTKEMVKSQKESERSNGLLKKLLDDAMRKLKKYEFCADKEEQLEKQKRFLQSRLDRCVADRHEAEKKLRGENWKIRQELKKAVNRVEQVELELKTLHKSPSSLDGKQDDHESLLQEDGTKEEMSTIIGHLDILFSK